MKHLENEASGCDLQACRGLSPELDCMLVIGTSGTWFYGSLMLEFMDGIFYAGPVFVCTSALMHTHMALLAPFMAFWPYMRLPASFTVLEAGFRVYKRTW